MLMLLLFVMILDDDDLTKQLDVLNDVDDAAADGRISNDKIERPTKDTTIVVVVVDLQDFIDATHTHTHTHKPTNSDYGGGPNRKRKIGSLNFMSLKRR
mmetsp:Transcript_11674/g.27969  ORF Transcript_11674/g.27969 Transcript_11674/m.27969 type:complete len:99 (-) Transcript_11674:100-396(-)